MNGDIYIEGEDGAMRRIVNNPVSNKVIYASTDPDIEPNRNGRYYSKGVLERAYNTWVLDSLGSYNTGNALEVLQKENDELWSENQELKKEIEDLKQQLKSLYDNGDKPKLIETEELEKLFEQ